MSWATIRPLVLAQAGSCPLQPQSVSWRRVSTTTEILVKRRTTSCDAVRRFALHCRFLLIECGKFWQGHSQSWFRNYLEQHGSGRGVWYGLK